MVDTTEKFCYSTITISMRLVWKMAKHVYWIKLKCTPKLKWKIYKETSWLVKNFFAPHHLLWYLNINYAIRLISLHLTSFNHFFWFGVFQDKVYYINPVYEDNTHSNLPLQSPLLSSHLERPLAIYVYFIRNEL